MFNNTDFHCPNNVASELYKLEERLFGYGEKQKLLRALQPYHTGTSKTARCRMQGGMGSSPA